MLVNNTDRAPSGQTTHTHTHIPSSLHIPDDETHSVRPDQVFRKIGLWIRFGPGRVVVVPSVRARGRVLDDGRGATSDRRS